MKLFYLAAVSASILAACSQPSNSRSPSKLSDINIVQSGTQNALLWIANDQVSMGLCDANAIPRRDVCQGQVASSPITTVVNGAGSAIDTQIAATNQTQADETKRLKDADPTIVALAQQIATLSAQKAGLEQKLAAETQLLSQDQSTKSAQDANVTWYDAQLKSVKDKLAQTPGDRDLLRLAEQYQTEREAAAAASTSLAQSIASLTAETTQDQANLAKVTNAIQPATDAFNQMYSSLVVHSPMLDQLTAMLSSLTAAKNALPTVIDKLKQSDIVFRSSLLTADEKAALDVIAKTITPQLALKSGTYKDTSGGTYCPQGVQVSKDENNQLTLAMSFLSPCAASATLQCDASGTCTGTVNGESLKVTITDSTHYTFWESAQGVTDNFAFDQATLRAIKPPFSGDAHLVK